MEYAHPEFSRRKYDLAGEAFVNLVKDDPRRDQAIDKIGNWRGSHAFLAELVNSVLTKKVAEIDPLGITSQRLKRLDSIEIKLRRGTRFTQIQDIGGCRAILQNIELVRQLSEIIQSSELSLGNDAFVVSIDKDYISNPKADGYRGIHLIAEYIGASEKYRKLQIELQIRTMTQHLWATTLEVCEFFTGKRFKTLSKTADIKWLRYFALAGGYFALMEKSPPVPGIPQKIDDIYSEMQAVDREICIVPALSNWTVLESSDLVPGSHYYVLKLSGKQRSMEVRGFSRVRLAEAEKIYLDLEKLSEGDPSRQVVLVSVEKLDSLKAAYSNYFSDTLKFVTICINPPNSIAL